MVDGKCECQVELGTAERSAGIKDRSQFDAQGKIVSSIVSSLAAIANLVS